MSSDGCPVLNPHESEEFAKKLSTMVKHFMKFEVNYDAYIRKPDKERVKLICAIIKQDEQRMLNTYQGINWLYKGLERVRYEWCNNFSRVYL